MYSNRTRNNAPTAVTLIGKSDPLAYPHLQARVHVKAESDAERDRAYLAQQRKRESRKALRDVVCGLAVLAVAALGAVLALHEPVTYSHVRVVAGEAYTLDYGLSAEDCAAVAQAASDDCVRE